MNIIIVILCMFKLNMLWYFELAQYCQNTNNKQLKFSWDNILFLCEFFGNDR